jgi:hypothetical protein
MKKIPPLLMIGVALLCVSCSISNEKKTQNTSCQPETTEEFSQVKQSLDQHGISLIGENHTDPKPRDFITRNLCSLNVNTLYLEALSTEFQEKINQPDITKEDIRSMVMQGLGYGNSEKFEDLGAKDKGWIQSYTRLIIAAKEGNITIIPLEKPSQTSDGVHDAASMEARLKRTNTQWTAAIKEQQKNPETRGIALTGADHTRTSFGVPGLNRLLGVPLVDLSNTKISWEACATQGTITKQTIEQLTAALTPTETLKSMDSFLTQLPVNPVNIEKLDTLEGALKNFTLNPSSGDQATIKAVQERVDLVCAWQIYNGQPSQK